MLILPDGLDIPVFCRVFRPPVGHADLLTLIQEGCSLLEQIGGRQRLSAFGLKFLAAVAGDHTGMIVVFNVKHVPRLALEFVLPVGKGTLHLAQGKFCGNVVGKETIGAFALELDHHVDLAILFVNVLQGSLGPNKRSLCQSEAVVVIKYVPLELCQIFVDAGTVIVLGHSLVYGEQMVVGQTFRLGNIGNHILTEAVHTHVQPETQDLLDLFPHQRIVHIQVGLLDGKQVQVILLAHLIPSPCFALKIGIPVVGQLAARLTGTPDVIIGIGLDALSALLEPLVLITGVIDHKVHDQLHAPLMGALQNLLECLHTAKFRGNIHVVGDVIPAVGTGRRINGRKPNTVTAKGFDIIQLIINTPQIAHAVPVAILKAAGPDLIKYHVFVPAIAFHRHPPPVSAPIVP